MKGRFLLREAQEEDISSLAKLKQAACLLFGENYKSDIPFTGEDFSFFKKNGFLLVATDQDHVIGGYIGALKEGNDLFLYHLFVAPEHAGQGVGSFLLMNLEGLAQRGGFSAITLVTSASAPWNAPFYERREYRVLEETEMPEYLYKKWQESKNYFSPENPVTKLCPLIVPRVAMCKDLV